jgi:hypothetical protein
MQRIERSIFEKWHFPTGKEAARRGQLLLKSQYVVHTLENGMLLF